MLRFRDQRRNAAWRARRSPCWVVTDFLRLALLFQPASLPRVSALPPANLVELAANAVGATQRGLPADLRALARGVIVHYEAQPAASVIASGFPSDILGLFTGPAYGDTSGHEPGTPQIMLYLDNLWDFAEADETVFKDEVQLTYLHELGHYLGWDEDEVAARGLD